MDVLTALADFYEWCRRSCLSVSYNACASHSSINSCSEVNGPAVMAVAGVVSVMGAVGAVGVVGVVARGIGVPCCGARVNPPEAFNPMEKRWNGRKSCFVDIFEINKHEQLLKHRCSVLPKFCLYLCRN